MTYSNGLTIAVPAFYGHPEQGLVSAATNAYPYPYSLLGDMNGDSVVNFDDIDPFVLALGDKPGYAAQYGKDADLVGDANGDWTLDFDDIDPFQAMIGSAERPIPIRLLIDGTQGSFVWGDAGVVAAADCDGDSSFDEETEADSVRATVLDTLLDAPLPAELGSPREWGASLQVSPFSSVNLRNGNLLTDIAVHGWSSFGPNMDFRIYHNSRCTDAAGRAAGASLAVGGGWMASYGGCLRFYPNPQQPTRIAVIDDDGRATVFSYNDVTQEWDAPPGVHDRLEYDTTVPDEWIMLMNDRFPLPTPTWVVTRKDQWRRLYSDEGQLLLAGDSYREKWLAIRVAQYDRDAGSQPVDVRDAMHGAYYRVRDRTACRLLSFHYDLAHNCLESIREENVYCREVYFQYEPGTGRLSSVEQRNTWVGEDFGCVGNEQVFWNISFTYDAEGRIDTLTGKEGSTYDFDYDALGRVTQVTPPALEPGDSAPVPSPATFTYDHVAGTEQAETRHVDARQKEWKYRYELWGGLTSITDPMSRQVSFDYDADRNVTQFQNERGATWLITYDGQGNPLETTNPLGCKWRTEHDQYNNLTKVVPPLDNSGNLNTAKQVRCVYEDYYGTGLIADFTNVTGIVEPADGQGSPATETQLEYWHAYAGRLDLTRAGRIRLITDKNGVENWFDYQWHWGAFESWHEGAIDEGRTDLYSVKTLVDNDKASRPTGVHQWNSSAKTTYKPDDTPSGGECVSGEAGGIYRAYDGRTPPPDDYMPVNDCSRLVPACSVHIPMPNCRSEDCGAIEFDKLGNFLSSSRTIQAVYGLHAPDNGLGAITENELSDRSVTRVFDPLYRLRSVTLETQELTATSTNYDDQNRPSVTRSCAFVPDGNGNVLTMTGPDNSVTEYQYDDANRLTQIKVDTVVVVTYDYSQWVSAGRIIATYQNGTSTEWVFDAANQLDQVTHKHGSTVLLDLDYTWTPDGLVDSIAETGQGGSYTVDFTYDNRNRLLRETRTGGSGLPPECYDLGYTYDEVGNRLTKTDYLADPDLVTTYHYDYQDVDWDTRYGTINNRLIWQKTHAQTTPEPTLLETKWYDYWRGGHVQRIVTEDPVTPNAFFVEHFQYNGAEQMWLYRTYSCAVNPADPEKTPINVVGLSAWEFRYGADRQRYLVRERDPNIPDWDDPNRPLYLTPLGDGQWRDYVGDQIYSDFTMDLTNPLNPLVNLGARYHHAGRGDGALTAVDGGSGYTLADRRFFHGDMLGTTRLLTGTGGTVAQSAAFTAFGELLGSAPLNMPRYGYCGTWGYQDDRLANAGWTGPKALHVGARWLDPASGRFVARDPIGILGGLNVYAYANNVPSILIDPHGLMSFSERLTVQRVQTHMQKIVGGTWRVTQHAVDKMVGQKIGLNQVAATVRHGAYVISRSSGRLVFRLRNLGVVVEKVTEGGGPVNVLVTCFTVGP